MFYFSVTVTSLKCSPRSLVRSRRSGHIGPSPVIVSPDPDLLIPIRTSLRRYVDEEGEHLKFSTLVKQYVSLASFLLFLHSIDVRIQRYLKILVTHSNKLQFINIS